MMNASEWTANKHWRRRPLVGVFQYQRLRSMLRKSNIPAQGLVPRGQLNKYLKINCAVCYAFIISL